MTTLPATPTAELTDNCPWMGAKPALSVLMPFLRDDPRELLKLLDREAASLGRTVEIVVLDDGTDDPRLTTDLIDILHHMALPARLITLARNEGRAMGRNRLAEASRGGSLLFLDSDMRPDQFRFLETWIALVNSHDPAVAFGGFSLLQASTKPKYAVHRAMATKATALPMPASLSDELALALKKNEPLLVMVSLVGCPFCHVARESYLAPLRVQEGLPVVQIDMRNRQNVIDFQGQTLTQDELIRRWGVKVAPTVLFFGRGGVEIADRLVGGYIPDFYGAYLDERLKQARVAIKGKG